MIRPDILRKYFTSDMSLQNFVYRNYYKSPQRVAKMIDRRIPTYDMQAKDVLTKLFERVRRKNAEKIDEKTLREKAEKAERQHELELIRERMQARADSERARMEKSKAAKVLPKHIRVQSKCGRTIDEQKAERDAKELARLEQQLSIHEDDMRHGVFLVPFETINDLRFRIYTLRRKLGRNTGDTRAEVYID